ILLIFSGLLAIAAYTDVCKRWIPDLIIYLLVIVSVYSLHTKDVFTSLIAMAFYMAPVVILSLYGYIVKKETWIASGDYYVFPSIGLLLSPEYAAVIMLITLFFMLFFMQWVKQIPLVTVAYFTFTGFNVCSLLGFL
ncbi:prepilin peptidase, partial [Cronobacter sakazakii]|nr:prepilin peptidase [Cronobacter sakazakii]